MREPFSEPVYPDDDCDGDCAEERALHECREAMRRYLSVISSVIEYIHNADNKELASWQVAFAIGTPSCWGRSMRDVAADLGVSVQAISKGAIQFCTDHNLPPSQYMRTDDARQSYRIARIKQVRAIKAKAHAQQAEE